MTDRYKEKVCPNCNITHKKRGIYCGQSCANAMRDISDETKKKHAQNTVEYYRTPEGIASARLASIRMTTGDNITVEDFAIDIPEFREINEADYGQWDKAEDW
jgi:hypothetical protein